MKVLVACVGKPSVGKSLFLNSISNSNSKVGNFPFTTIEPNKGIAFVKIECPCKRFGKSQECSRSGKCVDGMRQVPIEILDVAGLVPGASQGEGLGNQFLNDLTAATCLIHVVDVSGTTDSGGKETIGYDPINDIDWLRHEIHSWVFGNLHGRWDQIKKRHVATKSSILDTLQAQMGGYGTNRDTLNLILEKFAIKDPLETWDDNVLKSFVDTFLDVRFPTVIALNKIDLPDSDKNIDRIFRKYDQSKIVLISALAENFLRKMHKQKYIRYVEGTDIFDTLETDPTLDLKPLDDKVKNRLERVQDLVLFRYGHTGVQECLQTCVKVLGLIPVYPVENVNNFSSGGTKSNKIVFRDCMWVSPGTTMRQLAHLVHPDLDKYYQYAETVGNVQLAEDDQVSLERNIISFKTTQRSN